MLFAFGFVGYAQQAMQDVIHLKNGSIIKGTIIEQVPNKSIKVQTADGSVFVYTFEEIEKMTKEVNNNVSRAGSLNTKTSKYTGIAEGNYLFYVGSGGGSLYGFRYVNALQTSKTFSIGLGTGVNFGSGGSIETPLFLDMRANFSKGNVTPFWMFNGGYCVSLTGGASTAMAGSGFGVKVFVAQNVAWHINLGYEARVYVQRYYRDYYSSVEAGTLLHFVGVRTGISF